MGNTDTKLNFRKAVIQLTTKTQVTKRKNIKARCAGREGLCDVDTVTGVCCCNNNVDDTL